MLTSTFNRVREKSKAYFIMQRAIEDTKQKTNSLTTDMDELKQELINETMKTILEKSIELDKKICSLSDKLVI